MGKLLGNIIAILIAGPLAFLGVLAALAIGFVYIALGLLALASLGWLLMSVIAWLNGVPEASRMFFVALGGGMVTTPLITGLTSLLGGLGRIGQPRRADPVPTVIPEAPISMEPVTYSRLSHARRPMRARRL